MDGDRTELIDLLRFDLVCARDPKVPTRRSTPENLPSSCYVTASLALLCCAVKSK
jgi:hypothetical protein